MTWEEALHWGARSLTASPTPRLDAEVLLLHILGVDRSSLYAHGDRELPDALSAAYRGLIVRRHRHEPVAYIVGHREFMGLDFYVERSVLIPRPETELLVETAIKFCLGGEKCRYLADVGTGSGAMAVSLAVLLPEAHCFAIDTSRPALSMAHRNAQRHGAAARVETLYGTGLQPLLEREGILLDVVVANLPYVRSDLLATLPPDVRLYEPLAALDGGSDGLDLYRALLPQVQGLLRPGGLFLFEISPEQAAEASALATNALPESEVQILQDYQRLARCVAVCRSRGQP